MITWLQSRNSNNFNIDNHHTSAVVYRFTDTRWQKPIYHQKMKFKGKHKDAIKNLDYTMIEDRLRTISWSIYCYPTGVVKPVTGSQPSHLSQKLCNQKDTHWKCVNIPHYRDRGPTADPSGEAIKIQHIDIFTYKKFKNLWWKSCLVLHICPFPVDTALVRCRIFVIVLLQFLCPLPLNVNAATKIPLNMFRCICVTCLYLIVFSQCCNRRVIE